MPVCASTINECSLSAGQHRQISNNHNGLWWRTELKSLFFALIFCIFFLTELHVRPAWVCVFANFRLTILMTANLSFCLETSTRTHAERSIKQLLMFNNFDNFMLLRWYVESEKGSRMQITITTTNYRNKTNSRNMHFLFLSVFVVTHAAQASCVSLPHLFILFGFCFSLSIYVL